MTHKDLTVTDVLNDPLIRLIMRADGVSVKAMTILLVNAANKQGGQLRHRKQQHVQKVYLEKAIPVSHSRPGTNVQAGR